MNPQRSEILLRDLLLVLVFATLASTVVSAAQVPGAAAVATSMDAFGLRAGVVLDPHSGAVYLAKPGGGIESLDTSTGNRRWSTRDADVPLVVFGDILFAWREQQTPGDSPSLEIVAMDRHDGGEQYLLTSKLPQGLWNQVDNGMGKQFSVHGWVDGSTVYFAWKARTRRIGGMRSSTSKVVLSEQVLRLDFASEQLLEQAISAPSSARPDLPMSERIAGLSSTQFVSADGEFVVASERGSDQRRLDSYNWMVASRASGDILGAASHFVSYSPFGVVGTNLIHEVRPHSQRLNGEMQSYPLSIRAVDLNADIELWVREIRDVTYKGAYPP